MREKGKRNDDKNGKIRRLGKEDQEFLKEIKVRKFTDDKRNDLSLNISKNIKPQTINLERNCGFIIFVVKTVRVS
jgi:hypothetical protein